jgi:serine protease AprX
MRSVECPIMLRKRSISVLAVCAIGLGATATSAPSATAGTGRTTKTSAAKKAKSKKLPAPSKKKSGTVPTSTPPPAAATTTQTSADVTLPLGALSSIASSIGVDKAWAAGIDGSGVVVAVIDSGVANVAGLSYTDKVTDSYSFNGTRADEFGHGTHMAGIIAGNDGLDGGFRGIAPKASIFDIRVADANGNTDVTRVVDGIDAALAAKAAGRNIKVMLIALAAVPLGSYIDDPLSVAVEKAWRAGIVVVVSVGNGGTGPVASPGYDPYILAVGAIDPKGTPTLDDDRVAEFTSGIDSPTARRADVVVPAVSVQSLRSPGSYIDRNAGAGIVNDHILRGSGTSQAAAVVAGSMALLAQKYPNASPDQLKELARATADPLSADGSRGGSGRLRVDHALLVNVLTEGEAAQTWPSAQGLPTVAVEGLRPPTIKVASGFASTTPGATGNTWTGNTWTGNTWSGNTWSGNTWS